MDKKLSKKTTLIVSIAIAVFVLIALVVNIVLSNNYYSKRPEIINASESTDSVLVETKMLSLVYGYENYVSTIDVNKVIKLSEGTTFKITDVWRIKDDSTITIFSKNIPITNGESYRIGITLYLRNKRESRILYLVPMDKKIEMVNSENAKFNINDITLQ
ncbi:MAG: hypothetical protein K5765_05900 [Clostridia bacterium]|nr:hypothetical protein [Clostridia bacterium]